MGKKVKQDSFMKWDGVGRNDKVGRKNEIRL